jgi:hypothetical protein
MEELVMKWNLFIFPILILLVFLPIPIKITFNYKNNSVSLYIFKFKVKLFRRIKSKRNIEKAVHSFKYKNLDLDTVKLMFHKINGLKFKPTLRINLNLDYGFLDASSTGIAYGIICSLSPFLYKLLSVVFKIKKYNTSITPDFDNIKLSVQINSIIFVSLAKIIYIAITLFKSVKLLNKVNKHAYNNI